MTMYYIWFLWEIISLIWTETQKNDSIFFSDVTIFQHDVNKLRREVSCAMAVVQPKLDKDDEDCSLLPLVHDIIKW